MMKRNYKNREYVLLHDRASEWAYIKYPGGGTSCYFLKKFGITLIFMRLL